MKKKWWSGPPIPHLTHYMFTSVYHRVNKSPDDTLPG